MTRRQKQPGPRRVTLPPRVISGTLHQWSLLRPLLPVGAGYSSGQKPPLEPLRAELGEGLLIYCLKGSGWCGTGTGLQPIRAGDLAVSPCGKERSGAIHGVRTLTLLWIEAVGEALPEYFRELGVIEGPRVLHPGDDPQLVRLFYDVLRLLESGFTFPKLLQAAHALGALLALAIDKRQEAPPQNLDVAQKIAGAITYMSEHLKERLSVSGLARLANLSPAYFGSLFRAHTGSSPRDYLHFLRMHRACQMLQGTALNVKEIAGSLGYQDQFHFSRQFKAFQGFSPSEYRTGQRWRL